MGKLALIVTALGCLIALVPRLAAESNHSISWIAPREMVSRGAPHKMSFKGSMPYVKCKAPESSLSNAVAATPDAVIRLMSSHPIIRVDLLLLQLGTQP